MIEFAGLFLVQLVDIGIAAVREGSAFDEMRLDARRRIPERARPGLNDVFVLLLVVLLDERGPLDRPQFAADADRSEIVDERLADIGIRRVAVVVAGIEAAGMTGIGEQLFRPVGVVYRGVRGRLPEGFVTVR